MYIQLVEHRTDLFLMTFGGSNPSMPNKKEI